MKKALFWLAAVAIIVWAGISLSSPKDSLPFSGGSSTGRASLNEKNPIKIGVIEPLTGGAAPYGEAGKNGFMMAVEEINAAGGINGRKLEAIYEDSKCDGKTALGAVQKLVSIDGVHYIVGAMCSSEVLAVLPVTEAKPMIFLGEGSSPDITGKGKYFFRTWPSDALSSKAMADKVAPAYKKIAIITEKTDYATALEKSFSENVTKNGSDIVSHEAFVSGTKDFRAALSKIKAARPDLLFINPQAGENGAIIAKQARDLGIDAQFIAYFFTGDEFVKSGPAVNGTLIIDTPSLNSDRPISKAYSDRYKARYASSDYPFVGAQMYDYAFLLKDAIEKTGADSGSPADTEKIAAYLRNLDSYPGVIGDFAFDQNGDVENIGFSYKRVLNNALVDVK